MQLLFGLAAFVLQLPFSIHKDIGRIKQLRYGRRLKGPVLVNAKEFTAAVSGNGIGIKTDDFKLPLRIQRDAENKHFLIVGDTGSGKSSIIRQMFYQVDARGDSAIVYDPACEFVKQFYDEHRGDIVLNPLDARMPYWNPSMELRRKAEAKALAVSLYQPEGVTNRFFVEAPQKIFAHLLSYLPTPEDLIKWMSDSAEIDRRVKGTEYWMLIDPKAPQQRTGVLGSLNMSADSFRLLPKESETTSVWTATNWAESRRGWIFITSRPTMQTQAGIVLYRDTPAQKVARSCNYAYVVEKLYGPWLKGDNWWNESIWGNEQWDVVGKTSDGAILVCRLSHDFILKDWRVAGLYD